MAIYATRDACARQIHKEMCVSVIDIEIVRRDIERRAAFTVVALVHIAHKINTATTPTRYKERDAGVACQSLIEGANTLAHSRQHSERASGRAREREQSRATQRQGE